MYNLEAPGPPEPRAYMRPDKGRAWRASPEGRGRARGVSTLGEAPGVGPWLAAGAHCGRSSRRPCRMFPARLGGLSEYCCEGVDGAPLLAAGQTPGGPLSGTPAPPGTTAPSGAAGGRRPWPYTRSAVSAHRSEHLMWRSPSWLCAALPVPPDERAACAEAGPAVQSTFSTLPMIFSSKTGSTASSSRTSSNTTPQSNSSLTFLK